MLIEVTLVVVALVAGASGTWSPCGLSMIETLAPHTHRGGRSTTTAGCVSFAFGALVGGALTFGSLGLLGALLPLGRTAGLTVAAAVAVAAACGEARGVRIVPQIRRQVPEPWRRRMPLPVAAGLYGWLLGVGFTTFVLTFAVWALAAISLALGAPTLGVAIGFAFGLGRALPVVVLAPLTARDVGIGVCERIAMQPALLRRLRLVDGIALLACASALTTATASAAITVAAGTDPSRTESALTWQRPGASGILQPAGAAPVALTGTDPALGGPFIAVRNGDMVTVSVALTGAIVRQLAVSGAEKLALSRRWLAVRTRGAHASRLLVWRLDTPGAPRLIARIRNRQGELSRPALAGNRLVFAITGRAGSRIVERDLRRGRRTVLRRARRGQLLNPSLFGSRLLYVESDYCAQRLLLGPARGGRDRVLLAIGSLARRDRGFEPGHTSQGSEPSRCPPPRHRRANRMLWTTALGPRVAYVTVVPLHSPRASSIVRIHR